MIYYVGKIYFITTPDIIISPINALIYGGIINYNPLDNIILTISTNVREPI
jgi:hypothetical protein